MRISQTLSVLFFAGSALLVSTVVVEQTATAGAGDDAIFLGTQKPIHGTNGLPEGLSPEVFTVSADDSLVSNPEDSSNGREPASVKPAKKDNWSAQTTDGFLYKIRVKQQVSSVWVMKRQDHYDLVFANNTGSRMSVTLPAQQFYALKNAATDLRTPASDVSRCRDEFIQLEVVQAKTLKTMAMCLNQKSKAADELRQFGSALTAYVR